MLLLKLGTSLMGSVGLTSTAPTPLHGSVDFALARPPYVRSLTGESSDRGQVRSPLTQISRSPYFFIV